MSTNNRDRIDRHDRRLDELETSLKEAKSNGRAERRNSMVVALIGAAAIVAVAGIGIAGNWLQPDEPVSCTEERSRAADLVTDHPRTWIPLKVDDPVQEQCSINEYVVELEGPHTSISKPKS